MRGPPRARHLHRGTDPKPTRGGGGFLLFFAITVAQGKRRRPRGGTAMLQAIECASTYELRGEGESPDCANVGLPPPVLAYCCSRGLLFTIVVHQGYCCSVVTVNNNNTVQKLTFGNSMPYIGAATITPGVLHIGQCYPYRCRAIHIGGATYWICVVDITPAGYIAPQIAT